MVEHVINNMPVYEVVETVKCLSSYKITKEDD